ncbi:hypothetical protein NKH18_23720 [Streptomyces sp. M10(2022)]
MARSISQGRKPLGQFTEGYRSRVSKAAQSPPLAMTSMASLKSSRPSARQYEKEPRRVIE